MMMSFVPTNGPNIAFPDATVETMNFGTPNGSSLIAAVPISVPCAPPIERIPWNPSRPVRFLHQNTGAFAHGADAPALVPQGEQFGDRRTARLCHPMAGDVGHMPAFLENSGVHQKHPASKGFHFPLEIQGLLGFGIERRDQKDRSGRHLLHGVHLTPPISRLFLCLRSFGRPSRRPLSPHPAGWFPGVRGAGRSLIACNPRLPRPLRQGEYREMGRVCQDDLSQMIYLRKRPLPLTDGTSCPQTKSITDGSKSSARE